MKINFCKQGPKQTDTPVPEYFLLPKWKPQSSNNNNNNNKYNNNSNNCIQRHKLRFSTNSSLHREPSPTCTLQWPGSNRVQITCNTSSTYHVQHLMLRAMWYEGAAQLFSLTELKLHLFEVFVFWGFFLLAEPLTDELVLYRLNKTGNPSLKSTTQDPLSVSTLLHHTLTGISKWLNTPQKVKESPENTQVKLPALQTAQSQYALSRFWHMLEDLLSCISENTFLLLLQNFLLFLMLMMEVNNSSTGLTPQVMNRELFPGQM